MVHRIFSSVLFFLVAAPIAVASPQHARGSGLGDFVAHLDQAQAPAGAKVAGVENPCLSVGAMAIFDAASVDGGLYRFNTRLHILAGRAEEAAQRVMVGKLAGMKVLMTAVGTPEWNATTAPPGQPWWDLPDYARSVPADMDAWAADLVTLLTEMQAQNGELPDYLEIWNEPEREEWWAGDQAQFAELFGIAATAVKAAFPTVKVGGPGLAAARSDFGGTESFLMTLIDRAATTPHPLDFLSWHHYDIASAMRYFGTAADLRARLASHGMQAELFVSEFNIYPGVVNNPNSHEFDGPHAAAQFAGVTSSVVDLGIDGACFFMAQDVEPERGVLDLTGRGLGCLTRRGVKKPVFRIMEFLNGTAAEPRVAIDPPTDEWAVSMSATRNGNRVRFVIGNDVVPPLWVWSNGCRELGGEPGYLWVAVSALINSGRAVTTRNLQNQGLTSSEADIVMQAWPLTQQADLIARSPRSFRIQLDGAGTPVLTSAWLFDATHNAPATRRIELEPTLLWVEAEGRRVAYEAAAAFLAANGVIIAPYDPSARYPSTPEAIANALGISLYLANETLAVYGAAFEEARIAHSDLLNSMPAASLTAEIPGNVGAAINNGAIEVTLQPNAVLVLDMTL